jgi:hypothetical protein
MALPISKNTLPRTGYGAKALQKRSGDGMTHLYKWSHSNKFITCSHDFG